MLQPQYLSRTAKRSLAKGIISGTATLTAYLLVVIATTPSLPASAAIRAAFDINSPIILGTAGAVGAQVFFASYGKSIGCSIDRKRAILGAGSGGTAIGSFFSFFSLVPLGCCGSWLLILSFLPSVFGGALSVALIEYSQPFSHGALAAVLGFAGLSGLQLRKRLKERKHSV
ncbi:MAG: hypothetical protein ACREAY_10290 [Nitrososphaera sp.]|uniref:hypothetical protein n=1 Tax=Nitrososphaera sp. TaxID=1971748 RepID=UPI003D6F8F1A